MSTVRVAPGDSATDSSRISRLAPLLILLVVALGYGVAPTRLPLVGEETCRAQHGIEMAETGDWLIATNQGVPILDRPPLQYWALAATHRWIRPLDPLTLRLFMVGVIFATSLVIWWYARFFLTPTGACLAAVAYPTMGHVFDLGRRAETDGLYALLLAAALLVWHRGYAQGGRPWRTWSCAAILAALAALTKGLQAPVAFFGAVYLFLLIRRDWRFLFHPAHFVGLVLFVGVVAIWQVPFYLEAGWDGTRATWLDPGTSRVNSDAGDLLKHMAMLPLKALGATLPWSPLLVALLDRRFWSIDARARSSVLFMLLGMAAIFGPVWVAAGGHHRYIMPMYPLLAVVCGAVAQQCLSLDMSFSLRRFWRDYVRIVAVGMLLVMATFVGATIASAFIDAPGAQLLAQPWWFAVVLAVATVAGTFVLFRRAWRDGLTPSFITPVITPFIIAALLALFFGGAVLNVQVARAENVGPQVIAVRAALPEDAKLVSLRPIHHKFLYWYGRPIPVLSWPKSAANVPGDLEYFAFTATRGKAIDLPFRWERIAELNMDRSRQEDPEVRVVVGRRIRDGGS